MTLPKTEEEFKVMWDSYLASVEWKRSCVERIEEAVGINSSRTGQMERFSKRKLGQIEAAANIFTSALLF